MSWSPDPQTYSVFATLGFNAAIGGVVLTLFEYFRVRQLDIYCPKIRKPSDEPIPEPSSGFMGWIKKLWPLSDDEILRMAGMDAYVYLRFLKMCFKIGWNCCLGLIVLLPVYATGVGDSENVAIGINLYSMANIKPGGSRLWASFCFAYIFVGVFLAHIHLEYRNFALARAKFFNGIDKKFPVQMGYTILVENIPAMYRSSAKLRAFFEELFPNETLFACMAIYLQPLDVIVTERTATIAKLEQAIADFEASGRTIRPTIKPIIQSSAVCCGKSNKHADTEVEAIDYYSDQIAILSEEISLLQSEAVQASKGSGKREETPLSTNYKGEAPRTSRDTYIGLSMDFDRKFASFLNDYRAKITDKMVSGSGFVTFKSRRTATIAAQIPILSENAPALVTIPAPAPSDIVWSNMDATTEHTNSTAFFTSIAYYVGLLFWSGVLTFISLISNLSYLEKYLPFLSSLDTTSYAFLQGILPVIVLLVFLMLVPMIMAAVSTYIERRKTISGIQLEVFKWYFLYQIANVYLLLLTGSAITSVSDVIDDPAAILNYISAALPTTSVFFINFTITSLFSGVPLNLLNIGPFLYMTALRYLSKEKSLTRRTVMEGPLSSGSLEYGTALPGELYILCIMLLYWIIAPILLLVATFYFGGAYIVLKYNVVYVLERKYESGGRFWYGLYDYSMLALMVSTITFIFYMSISQGVMQAPLLLPLPILIIFAWRYTETKYKDLSLHVPYSTAVTADLKTEGEAVHDTFTENYLKQPNMIAPKVIYPYPYRIDGHRKLFDDNGLVDAVYLVDVEDGENPEVVLRDYVPPEVNVRATFGAISVKETTRLLKGIVIGGGGTESKTGDNTFIKTGRGSVDHL